MFRDRRGLVFCLDLSLIALSLYVSFLLRFDFRIPEAQNQVLLNGLMVIMIAKPLFFVASGMYRNIWKYASLRDAIEVLKVVTLSSIGSMLVLRLVNAPFGLPRSVYVLDWFVLLALVGLSRMFWRLYREALIIPSHLPGKRTLIIGAGDAGNLLLREIRKLTPSPYTIVGFVDDDPRKRGMRLSGIKVLGDIDHLKGLIRKHDIDNVIFSIPSAGPSVMRRVLASCEKANVRVRTLPGIASIIDGTFSLSQIKDVDIEDLLGRDPVVLDQRAIRNYLTGKRVLVTGAAGSIGSELCRQVAAFSPAKIVILDHAETPLFFIERELTGAFPDLQIIPVIADVKNRERIEKVFAEFRPEVVFHAAAYKHVAMMEYNPAEAVLNNVIGSRVLADAADNFKVRNFVMVSTDKAVNPTNVMGATKRSAEVYVQALAERSQTRFTTVRFGNVLGSNGSVIPLFKEQIRKGGPVTVTDPEVVRFFMTIPEASQLVLQAGCLGQGGEIFLLDMGEPVRILSLAEELIRLSGLEPYTDVDIVFTGLKPGEKLYEELLIDGEGILPTAHKKIRVSAPVESDYEWACVKLDALAALAKAGDIAGVLQSLKAIVPEFSPRYDLDAPQQLAFQRVRPDLFPPQKVAVVRSLRLEPVSRPEVVEPAGQAI
ncbi:nucleoside-diphosphate sugar epimerase/dehydratase [Geomonas sp.]|uniref:polysaccharide biosynthesis protein n=1 Tax=Geomonas sp. TaxID=2651584 RepID=UPI002B46EE54|nr:nucleoside-diphosphate sugar epimerase/dehydratase [Geomonas sp.]HJV33532.1 nucleoside-diphosphate sugar epimerase/dehydratase [Geomonas sp.]